MEDKGQKLYEMYQAAMAAEGMSVDAWQDLYKEDHAAWRQVAANIMEGGL